MLKKGLVLALICFSGLANGTESSKTTQHKAQYEISDTDVKIFVVQANNVEQCIFPELSGKKYSEAQKIYDHWSAEDLLAMRYFRDQLLSALIGETHFNTLMSDKASYQILMDKIDRFNHQNANVSVERCADFKQVYQDIKRRIEASRQK